MNQLPPADPMEALALAQTNAIRHLENTKADKRDVERVEAEMSKMAREMQYIKHNRHCLTVVALAGYLGITFDDNNAVGRQLSAKSRELNIEIKPRTDDRFGTVGSYEPYVCKLWCIEKGYPLHPVLDYAEDPR